MMPGRWGAGGHLAAPARRPPPGDAVRGVLGNAPAATVFRDIGLEVLVGAGWLALALLTFQRLADAGRRDGSIVFSSA